VAEKNHEKDVELIIDELESLSQRAESADARIARAARRRMT
jgi:hypothetical protein